MVVWSFVVHTEVGAGMRRAAPAHNNSLSQRLIAYNQKEILSVLFCSRDLFDCEKFGDARALTFKIHSDISSDASAAKVLSSPDFLAQARRCVMFLFRHNVTYRHDRGKAHASFHPPTLRLQLSFIRLKLNFAVNVKAQLTCFSIISSSRFAKTK